MRRFKMIAGAKIASILFCCFTILSLINGQETVEDPYKYLILIDYYKELVKNNLSSTHTTNLTSFADMYGGTIDLSNMHSFNHDTRRSLLRQICMTTSYLTTDCGNIYDNAIMTQMPSDCTLTREMMLITCSSSIKYRTILQYGMSVNGIVVRETDDCIKIIRLGNIYKYVFIHYVTTCDIHITCYSINVNLVPMYSNRSKIIFINSSSIFSDVQLSVQLLSHVRNIDLRDNYTFIINYVFVGNFTFPNRLDDFNYSMLSNKTASISITGNILGFWHFKNMTLTHGTITLYSQYNNTEFSFTLTPINVAFNLLNREAYHGYAVVKAT